ncbi:MAG: MvaI/BcnI family restriction endonuclease [Bacteroidota bacterium]
MNLEKLKDVFAANGCLKIYVKRLAANDNSKNQVYLGGSFDILNILPIREVTADSSGDWGRERFKAKLSFFWLDDNGHLFPAPHTQLILYPKYPEVRLSGFLLGCESPPSALMTERIPNRVLFLGVAANGTVIGFVDSPESQVSVEVQNLHALESYGVFNIIILPAALDSWEKLLNELRRIHSNGWIDSKKLGKNGIAVPYIGQNSGGYTLEAELGITPNGYSEPDFFDWEIKQFAVKDFKKLDSSVITLMTPEPTHGYYVSAGKEAFIRKYGYDDKKGRPDRMNFGGVHRVGKHQPITSLRMELVGFDIGTSRIRSSTGHIALMDREGNEVSCWSFASLIEHWNRKHNHACYIPSMTVKDPFPKFMYGRNVLVGSGADFQLFLGQMALGNVYYDPGIKMENVNGKVKIKPRSQFRTRSKFLKNLYRKFDLVDVFKSS